jgi:hypothetical protein
VDCRLNVCNCHKCNSSHVHCSHSSTPIFSYRCLTPLHRYLTHRVAPDENARGGCRGGAAPLSLLLTAKPNTHTHTLSSSFTGPHIQGPERRQTGVGSAALSHPTHCITAPAQYAAFSPFPQTVGGLGANITRARSDTLKPLPAHNSSCRSGDSGSAPMCG